jgi:hypothetical protein
MEFSKLFLFSVSNLLYLGRKQITKMKKLTTVKTRQKIMVLEELLSSVELVTVEGMDSFREGRKHFGIEVSLNFTTSVPLHLLIAISFSDKG